MTQNLQHKVDAALRLLSSAQKAVREEPIEVCFSGGKDSEVILELSKMAEINYRAIYKSTTIDPPGTIAHCLSKGAEVLRPRESFFQLIARKGFPSFSRRFCCEYLKEYKVLSNAVVGVRCAESTARAKRYDPSDPIVCRMYGKGKHVNQIMPLLAWTDNDIEQFISARQIQCHPLYYDKFGRFCVKRRLGCLGCPLPADRSRNDFKRYPRLMKAWLRAGQRYLDSHPDSEIGVKYGSVYDMFVSLTFFDSFETYDSSRHSLFPFDAKQLIEKYYNITL